MTATTQTSSPGWVYADTNTLHTANVWDGRMWPEIVGYRGSDLATQEPTPAVQQELTPTAATQLEPSPVVQQSNLGALAIAAPAQTPNTLAYIAVLLVLVAVAIVIGVVA